MMLSQQICLLVAFLSLRADGGARPSSGQAAPNSSTSLAIYHPADVHNINDLASHRKPRFYFPLFKIVQFKNDVCLTTDGLTGTCYTRTECTILGGLTAGFCAQGFGVCCFWDVTCGEIAIMNRTHFLSPGWRKPFNDERRCELIIKKPRVVEGICLLRLNFRDFNLAPPSNGRCAMDVFQVPHASKLPALCGNNTGHHMYVDFANPKELRIIVKTTTKKYARRWAIELAYIECTNPSLAPSGCLQFYTGPAGSVSTFNAACAPPSPMLKDITGTATGRAAWGARSPRSTDSEMKKKKKKGTSRNSTLPDVDWQCLLGSLDYSICVRLESDMCAIQWIAVVFDMGTDGITTSQRGDSCQQNYIGLAGGFSADKSATLENTKTFDRFCGRFLNADNFATSSVPISTFQKPFVVRVKTGPFFVGPFRGASFNYIQRICV